MTEKERILKIVEEAEKLAEDLKSIAGKTAFLQIGGYRADQMIEHEAGEKLLSLAKIIRDFIGQQ